MSLDDDKDSMEILVNDDKDSMQDNDDEDSMEATERVSGKAY